MHDFCFQVCCIFQSLVIFGMMSVDGTNVTSEDLENFLNICECENVPQHLKALFKQVCCLVH